MWKTEKLILRDAYAEGRRAYNDGIPKEKNPYLNTRNEPEWGAGWRAGKRDADENAQERRLAA